MATNYLFHIKKTKDTPEEWVFYYEGVLTKRFLSDPKDKLQKNYRSIAEIERFLGVKYRGPLLPYEEVNWKGDLPQTYPIPEFNGSIDTSKDP